VHLSFGDVPASEYLGQLLADHLVHAWDLAAAVGADRALDPAVVRAVAEWFAERGFSVVWDRHMAELGRTLLVLPRLHRHVMPLEPALLVFGQAVARRHRRDHEPHARRHEVVELLRPPLRAMRTPSPARPPRAGL